MSLSCKQLTVEIAGTQVCRQLDFTVEPGQIWGILGRNGIGKTTLLHTFAGLRLPKSGSIELDTANLQQCSRKSIAQKMAVLLQHHEDNFPVTVLETVLNGRHPHIDHWHWESDNDYAITRHALQQVDMLHLQQKSVQHLSGGERQRVAIATLLAQDPRYFLMDEPNSHLDLHFQISILEKLCRFVREQQRAIVMSLHDINLAARFCDHILLLNGDGDVVQGSTADMLIPDNLSKTFQHEIIAARSDHGVYFQPK